MSNLQAIEKALEVRDNAERAFRQTIADAVDGGVPISKIARQLHVTRQTIYSWLESLEPR